jgi:hypothetical protein
MIMPVDRTCLFSLRNKQCHVSRPSDRLEPSTYNTPWRVINEEVCPIQITSELNLEKGAMKTQTGSVSRKVQEQWIFGIQIAGWVPCVFGSLQ